jgi:hypothetical protein
MSVVSFTNMAIWCSGLPAQAQQGLVLLGFSRRVVMNLYDQVGPPGDLLRSTGGQPIEA